MFRTAAIVARRSETEDWSMQRGFWDWFGGGTSTGGVKG
jgi:hypothetical protein